MSTFSTIPNVFDADLPTLAYESDENPRQIYSRLKAAQRQAPIALGPYGPEVLSYHMARSILRDTRFQFLAGLNLLALDITSGPLWDKVVNSLFRLEGDTHHRLRSLTAKAFTPRAVLRLQDTMVDVMNGLVDQVIDAGRCDIVTDIARPYPVPIICALLGAPCEDWQQFSRWADIVFKAFSFNADLREIEPEIMRAWGELDEYVDDMITRRRDGLTDDLLSDLIRVENDGDRLNTDELRMIAGMLLIGGTDTTRNQVAASIQVLCEHPDQWNLIKERPELAPRAVEETMRHSPIVFGTVRRVVEDAEIGGYLFPAGTVVLVNTTAANRDPAVYADPDRLDILRDDLPMILTFGGGLNYCLGSNLARREITEAVNILTGRMENPRIAKPALWKPISGLLSGPASLIVEFDR